MKEDTPEPESEKPRYLLPEGCKDLIDVIRLQQRQDRLRRWRAEHSKSANPLPSPAPKASPLPLPASVLLPDTIMLRDLADLLNLKLFRILRAFMEMDCYSGPDKIVTFDVAAALCARLGVVANKAV